MKVSISIRSARNLLDIIDGGHAQYPSSSRDELRRAVAHAERPRPGLKKAKAVRGQKKRAKAKDTRSIRATVFDRADTTCECGCGKSFTMTTPGELDHFLGREKAKQSVGNCWALRSDCHHFKTLNQPSPEWWLGKFIKHAEKHGFDDEAFVAARRLESLELQAEAEAR